MLKGKLLKLIIKEGTDSEGDKYTCTIVHTAFRTPDGCVVRGERSYKVKPDKPPPAEEFVTIFYMDDYHWEVL